MGQGHGADQVGVNHLRKVVVGRGRRLVSCLLIMVKREEGDTNGRDRDHVRAYERASVATFR